MALQAYNAHAPSPPLQFLTGMRECGASGDPEAAFAAAYPDQRFTVFNVLGDETELVPGGRDIKVTLSNRLHFIDAALHWRLHEFDAQVRRPTTRLWSEGTFTFFCIFCIHPLAFL